MFSSCASLIVLYRCTVFEIFPERYKYSYKTELKTWNSPQYTLGQKFQIFVNFIVWNINIHCFACFQSTSYKILQSCSDIYKTETVLQKMQEIPPKFHDCVAEDFVEVAEGFLASFSPLTWWLYFPICFLNFLPHLLVKCIHFAGIKNSSWD